MRNGPLFIDRRSKMKAALSGRKMQLGDDPSAVDRANNLVLKSINKVVTCSWSKALYFITVIRRNVSDPAFSRQGMAETLPQTGHIVVWTVTAAKLERLGTPEHSAQSSAVDIALWSPNLKVDAAVELVFSLAGAQTAVRTLRRYVAWGEACLKQYLQRYLRVRRPALRCPKCVWPIELADPDKGLLSSTVKARSCSS